MQDWIAVVGAKTAYIERGSPWENGYIESFNARLRDELLNGEIFYTLREAQIVIESWRRHYNTITLNGIVLQEREHVCFGMVGTGRPGTGTDGWDYRYEGHLTQHWTSGIDQRPAGQRSPCKDP